MESDVNLLREISLLMAELAIIVLGYAVLARRFNFEADMTFRTPIGRLYFSEGLGLNSFLILILCGILNLISYIP